MKITDTNWTVLANTPWQIEQLMAYAKLCGIKTEKDPGEQHSDVYAKKGTQGVWFFEGALTVCWDTGTLQIIPNYQFLAMCDEYAAENKPESVEVPPITFQPQGNIEFWCNGQKMINEFDLHRGEFYCLLDGGTTPPRIIHPTLEAAKVEARRLVEAHGKPVRILRAMLEIKPAGRYIETQL